MRVAVLSPPPRRPCWRTLAACPRRSLSLEDVAPPPGLDRIPRAPMLISAPTLPRALDPPSPASWRRTRSVSISK